MKYTLVLAAMFAVAAGLSHPCRAQTAEAPRVSSGKAFALSLAVPGLGHRYAHDGDWDGWGTVFAVADVGLWASLAGSIWRRDHLVQSYKTLAAQHAGVVNEGKTRDFYLKVATYESSDAYTNAQLRDRNWGEVDYARDPSFRWGWESDGYFTEFRQLRENAESLRRRRSIIATALVANRLVAGLSALRAARRANEPDLELSFDVPPPGSAAPLIRIDYRF